VAHARQELALLPVGRLGARLRLAGRLLRRADRRQVPPSAHHRRRAHHQGGQEPGHDRRRGAPHPGPLAQRALGQPRLLRALQHLDHPLNAVHQHLAPLRRQRGERRL
jgi:hypothetical protein